MALSVIAVKCVLWLYHYVENNLGEFCLDLLPTLTLLMSEPSPPSLCQIVALRFSGLLMQGILLTNEATAVGKRDFLVCLFSASAGRILISKTP